MNVSLTPELEKYITDKVSTGLYSSASEVVREGLRLLAERDELRLMRRERLRQLLNSGLDDLDEGRSAEFTEDVLEEIKRAGRERVSSGP